MSRLGHQLACCAALLALAGSAAANPLDAFGFGSRSIGLAGAATAVVDDFSANYYNPAALAAGDELRLELGYVFIEPALKMNGFDVGVDANQGFQGGVVLPGQLFGHAFGASVGLFLPDNLVSRIRSLPQSQPRFVLYDNRPQRVVVSASLGLEIARDLYIGGGLTFLANTKGVLEMQGEVALFEPENTQLFSAVDVDLEAVRYPTFGLLFTPGNWRFGVTWREEFSLRLDLDVDVEGSIINDIVPEDPEVLIESASFLMRSGNNNLYSPRQVAFGAAYADDEAGWMVTLDFTWVQWSRFPPPTATVDIELDLSNCDRSDPEQAEQDICPGGLDFTLPPIDAPLPTGFSDIFIPRVAGEYRVAEGSSAALTVRAGYSWEPTPAPDQPGTTNYADNDKHTWTAGLTLAIKGLEPTLSKPLVFDLALLLAWMPERTYLKEAAADPTGDYRIDGLFYGGSLTTKLLF